MDLSRDKLFWRLAPFALYAFSLAGSLATLFEGRLYGLFPMPPAGTDQLTILQASAGICKGFLPPDGYLYSMSYTFFLAALVKICDGDLLCVRALQAAVCALIPVMIYSTSLKLRFGKEASFIGGLLFCLYGPAQLICLDFLRASPLGLCFITMVFFLVGATMKKSLWRFGAAGAFAALCVLGRENFIPVVFVPFLLLFHPGVRRRVLWRGAAVYLAALAVPLFATLCLNYLHYGTLGFIPGYARTLNGTFGAGPCGDLKGALLMAPAQAWRFVCSYEMPNSLSFYAHRDLLDVLKALFVPFNALAALAFAGLLLGLRRPGVWLVSLLAASYAGSMLFFLILYRYRMPDVPLVCLLAGYGLYALVKGRASLKLRLAVAALALALFLASWQEPGALRPKGERFAAFNALLQSGAFAKAEDVLEGMRKDGMDIGELPELLRFKEAESLAKETSRPGP